MAPTKEVPPSMQLLYSLNHVAVMCEGAHHFRDLAAERRRSRDAVLERRKEQIAAMAREREERMRLGTASGKWLDVELKQEHDIRVAPIPDCVHAVWLSRLNETVASCESARNRALQALNQGGGALVDSARHPGTSNWSLNTSTRLRTAGKILAGLRASLAEPSIEMEQHAIGLRDLGEWARECCHEMAGTMELPASSTPPAVREPKAPRKPRGKIQVEAAILSFLTEHPMAKRDDVAEGTGCSTGRVSTSAAWKAHAARCKAAQRQKRACGLGGVGDPSVGGPRGERDDD